MDIGDYGSLGLLDVLISKQLEGCDMCFPLRRTLWQMIVSLFLA